MHYWQRRGGGGGYFQQVLKVVHIRKQLLLPDHCKRMAMVCQVLPTKQSIVELGREEGRKRKEKKK